MSGDVIKEARAEFGLSQEDLGGMTGYSRQAIGHLENNKRQVSEDFAKSLIDQLECPVIHMEMVNQLMKGASSPVLRGKNIERHRLALRDFALNELEEAMDHLSKVNLIKPPDQSTEQERDQIKVVMSELLDAIAGLQNLKAKLAKEYKISIPHLYEKRKPIWKTKGWI